MNPMNHVVRWVAPAPLWGRFDAEPGSREALRAEDQARPAILRFASDDFMDRLIAMLESDPRQIGTLIARPETWRGPSDEAPDLVERAPRPRVVRLLERLRTAKVPASKIEATQATIREKENGVERTKPLKLFHPAHQRFYLVGANLVCEKVGFPDRAVHPGGSEQVGFVLRRLLRIDAARDSEDLAEYAFVKDAAGARWQRVDAEAATPTMARGEEMLPLFPLSFRDDENHPRRLMAGLIPVGRREEYMGVKKHDSIPSNSAGMAVGAGAASTGTGDSETIVTARKEQFKMEVAEPWANLVRTVLIAAARNNERRSSESSPTAAQLRDTARAVNDQALAQSWLILLDFADYLKQHLEPVWNAIVGTSSRSDLRTNEQRRLFDWIDAPGLDPRQIPGTTAGNGAFISHARLATNLRDALQRIHASPAVRHGLERATRPFPEPIDDDLAWPDFAYPLAWIDKDLQSGGVHDTLKARTEQATEDDEDAAAPSRPEILNIAVDAAQSLEKLVQLVITAIDTTAAPRPAPPLPFAMQVRDAIKSTLGDPGLFVIRCAYVRCDCGPLSPPVLSASSQRFQLASFFDPDAPARPIRISLPLDTTAAGLRKHSKGTAFVISDVLCGQIQRAKGLGLGDLVMSVLPWPFHKDLDVKGLASCERGGNSLGMICSLSIPIITICALILLMIIVSLLDFIFKWMPWFVMCFPIPGLKAKPRDGDSP